MNEENAPAETSVFTPAQSRETVVKPTGENDHRSPAGGQRQSLRWTLTAASVLLLIVVCTVALLDRREGSGRPDPPQVNLEAASEPVATAVTAAREQVLDEPDSAEAWGRYAMCLYAHEFVSDALTCLEQAERLDPEDYRWPYLSGLCTTFSDPLAGRGSFERAARIRPELPFVRLRAAELLLDLQETDAAADHVQAALDREPQNPRAALAAARLAFLRGDLEASRRWAQQSAQFAPGLAAAYELLAKISFQEGDASAAREHLDRMRQSNPGGETWPDPVLAQVMQMRRDPQWLLVGAQQQLDAGRPVEAAAALRRILEEFPESIEARIELVQVLFSLGEAGEAETVLGDGLQRHPDSPRLHRMHGVLLSHQGEHERAAAEFRLAIDLKPNYALAHYNLGNCLLKLGDKPGARHAFEQALSLQPNLPGVRDELARLQQAQPSE